VGEDLSIPFYLITLDEEPLKRELAVESLEKINIMPTVVTGFFGDTLGLRPTNPMLFRQDGLAGEFIVPNHVGLILSHLLALKLAVHSGASSFIIAENDVRPVDDFVEVFNRIKSQLVDRDVVQFDYACEEDKPQRQLTENVWQCEYPMLTGCSWWSVEGAKKALRQIRILDAPYDILLVRKVYPFLKHGIVKPRIATQRTWYSTLHLTNDWKNDE
jgi:GR25 family glycosyltransferase involved in LPS biosynthesis